MHWEGEVWSEAIYCFWSAVNPELDKGEAFIDRAALGNSEEDETDDGLITRPADDISFHTVLSTSCCEAHKNGQNGGC